MGGVWLTDRPKKASSCESKGTQSQWTYGGSTMFYPSSYGSQTAEKGNP
jgi:hypothetical protein